MATINTADQKEQYSWFSSSTVYFGVNCTSLYNLVWNKTTKYRTFRVFFAMKISVEQKILNESCNLQQPLATKKHNHHQTISIFKSNTMQWWSINLVGSQFLYIIFEIRVHFEHCSLFEFNQSSSFTLR